MLSSGWVGVGLGFGANNVSQEAHHEQLEALHGVLLAQGLDKGQRAASVRRQVLPQALSLRSPLDTLWAFAGLLKSFRHPPGSAAATCAVEQGAPV